MGYSKRIFSASDSLARFKQVFGSQKLKYFENTRQLKQVLQLVSQAYEVMPSIIRFGMAQGVKYAYCRLHLCYENRLVFLDFYLTKQLLLYEQHEMTTRLSDETVKRIREEKSKVLVKNVLLTLVDLSKRVLDNDFVETTDYYETLNSFLNGFLKEGFNCLDYSLI